MITYNAEQKVRQPSDGEGLLERSFSHVPPPEFDPLTATQAELARYGIVPRPDARKEPVAFAHWLRIFAPPVVFVDPKLRLADVPWRLRVNTQVSAAESAAARVRGPSRDETSPNWSGAYVVPTDDTMVVLVAGLWAVPSLNLPPPEFRPPSATQYVCSTWVGLDGQRRYVDSTLPQTGTMQILDVPAFSPPQTSAIAFFQWWFPTSSGSFLQLDGLPVQPGDVMLGAIWAATETKAIAYLRNVTTGDMAIVGATAPSSPPGVEIAGATAEWILERPSIPGSPDRYPFPAYSTTSFACWAGMAGTAGPPQSWRNLERARLIRMYDTLPRPMRTAFISMPEKQDDAAVQCEYGDFKDL